MVEVNPGDQVRAQSFVVEYLDVIRTNVIEISHKRNTLKSRVKQISQTHKIAKDFANYISLFLMVTKTVFIENKIWKVNETLAEKLNRPGFLSRNIFKFLSFTRDYNEYYKSPLVFNTIYSNNDFEVVNKRKSILRTLGSMLEEENIAFESFYQTVSRRYAYFRDFNNPSNFYYTKGEVFSNKQFIFIFVFKTLNFLGVVQLERKGKVMSDYYFKFTEFGKQMISDFMINETMHKRQISPSEKRVVIPYNVIEKTGNHRDTLNRMFNEWIPNRKSVFILSHVTFLNEHDRDRDFLATVRGGIVRRVQSENIPNLLV